MTTMGGSALAFAPDIAREDPLAHLPRSTMVGFKKKRVIYSQDRPPAGIYLVLDGKVKVCRVAEQQEVVVEIYRAGDFFGESSLLGLPQHAEQATALENTTLMTWSAEEIEQIISRQPRLAVALWQILVQRTIELGRRIESFSLDTVSRRLARSLIRCSERLGAPTADGSIQMAALTHETLAQYVGTSREIVTHHMNQFRRQGYLSYSHKEITLNPNAFTELLRADTGTTAAL